MLTDAGGCQTMLRRATAVVVVYLLLRFAYMKRYIIITFVLTYKMFHIPSVSSDDGLTTDYSPPSPVPSDDGLTTDYSPPSPVPSDDGLTTDSRLKPTCSADVDVFRQRKQSFVDCPYVLKESSDGRCCEYNLPEGNAPEFLRSMLTMYKFRSVVTNEAYTYLDNVNTWVYEHGHNTLKPTFEVKFNFSAPSDDMDILLQAYNDLLPSCRVRLIFNTMDGLNEWYEEQNKASDARLRLDKCEGVIIIVRSNEHSMVYVPFLDYVFGLESLRFVSMDTPVGVVSYTDLETIIGKIPDGKEIEFNLSLRNVDELSKSILNQNFGLGHDKYPLKHENGVESGRYYMAQQDKFVALLLYEDSSVLFSVMDRENFNTILYGGKDVPTEPLDPILSVNMNMFFVRNLFAIYKNKTMDLPPESRVIRNMYEFIEANDTGTGIISEGLGKTVTLSVPALSTSEEIIRTMYNTLLPTSNVVILSVKKSSFLKFLEHLTSSVDLEKCPKLFIDLQGKIDSKILTSEDFSNVKNHVLSSLFYNPLLMEMTIIFSRVEMSSAELKFFIDIVPDDLPGFEFILKLNKLTGIEEIVSNFGAGFEVEQEAVGRVYETDNKRVHLRIENTDSLELRVNVGNGHHCFT
ncbi:FirrV-1-D6 [Feldmannia irregularis virus a]|uniref:FirrV-1-D6 n=1 Tax=Feldmannia irregularis virus a TaxID=231992 RepID=Q6XLW3_9PHYC|nr:FirrV-1-D6 [Feldmannia irregularis virus a]AAR26948.1 FirrV-1-D6 [Feldmannia irregularis virus a]